MNIQTFFGDANTCTFNHKTSDFNNWCQSFLKNNNLSHVIFNNQTHSTDGRLISDTQNLESVSLFEQGGDFLITNQPRTAIGVLTADCLPIIFYDPINNVIAIAHAGWRGSVASINEKVIHTMQQQYNTLIKDLHIWFGPSAKKCCYQVQPDFLDFLKNFPEQMVIEKRNDKLFFDNSKLNADQLIKMGVSPKQIDTAQNICTICNHQFHSYRRSKDIPRAQRQATLVWLSL